MWSNGTHHQEEEGGGGGGGGGGACSHQTGKHQRENGQQTTKMNGHSESDDTEHQGEEEEQKKKSFFGLCFSEDLEKELAEQSKLALKMIYFFQVLPFYVLQFTSGMALGKIIKKEAVKIGTFLLHTVKNIKLFTLITPFFEF